MKYLRPISACILGLAMLTMTSIAYAADDTGTMHIAKLFNNDPDKEHIALATDYAQKGLFKFAIIEFNKVSVGSPNYLESIQNAAFLALKMQEQDYEKNHYTKPVDASPLIFTASLFSSKTGALEDFMPGSNSPAMQIELYSISNTPVTSITFKVFCYDTMLEPLNKNGGVYIKTIDHLNIKPYTFYNTVINLDEMGKVNDAKIAIMEVTFADNTNWISPLKNSDVKQDKDGKNIKNDNMPKHF